ncbi:CRISPR-associated protein Cas4 [Thermoactinomyces mirandus]|uniref:CRISPR-associated exonuclease Cas4 n=1 Tax=Thermoactinomyces mirandus TaxID=2756294 RepID=A0A7W1XRB0_9BACL|nr:CRISPR-associated protein Cas4 [Thermoactinomyces mirandus]MBA4601742.1 CRISPR-associated protein Cas4 [Thermoactinomyces mirandus]
MEMMVEAHAINAYIYCPRRCYYEYVERVFYHNVYTIHGKLLHDHVDHAGMEHRGERQLFRSLYLRSESLGLSVRCDVIEEADGSVYPVEYKRGQQAGWENNHLQLCAQGLALEERIGREVAFGYLFYYGSFRREKVMFDKSLRERTKQAVKEIQSLYFQDLPPEGIDDWAKCQKCSMADYCLPQERAGLKGKVPWEHFI